MATAAHSEPRRHYSWWWNSHISPKNSKWLQENLTDMDMKVKAMIKLIEEDADSFARRAEMYYKKRPELMKLVEEFYRAYRALAERYDHATGALRQAHRTMAEAFPNQIPLLLSDDSPQGSSTSDVEPHTPEMPPPVRALFDPDELQKDAIGLSSDIHVIRRNGAHLKEINSLSSKKVLKQLTGISAIRDGTAHTVKEARMQKALNFQEEEEEAFDIKSQKGSREVQHATLKQDRSNIIENPQQDNARLLTENQNLKCQVLEESDRANKAESEVQNMKDAFSKKNLEKDANNLQYQTSLERISVLESQLSNTQNDLKKLNENFTNEVEKLKSAEQLNGSLKLELDMLGERVNMQEAEIQSLKDALSKLNSEKEADQLQYQTSLQRILVLETQLSEAESDLKKLNELKNKVQELGIAEQLNRSLEQELDELEKRAKIKVDDIKDEHYELDKLQVHLNEKNQQCAQAEEALHSNEKLLVTCQEEMCKLKEKNYILNKENHQFTVNIKNLKDEIVLLKDQKDKLENEVESYVRDKEMLNQEVLQLKEDKNDMERRYQNLMELMNAANTSSESLQADIKELKERCKEHEAESMRLSEKLKYTDDISEKNVIFENSLTNANIELEMLRGEVLALDDSHKSRSHEKDSLVPQVQNLTLEVEKLSEKNISAEDSLSNANIEIERLSMKMMVCEESCQLLESQNSTLLAERNNLFTQVEKINLDLENTTSCCTELQNQHSTLSSELNGSTSQVKELQNLLQLEKQHHLHLTSTINNLQDEMIFLKNQKIKLEDQVRLCIREMEILNQENVQLKEDKIHLEKRQQHLTEQMNAVSIASELLQKHVNDLEQKFDKYKVEKVMFQEKLKYMNSVSEKNNILEKSISDANLELEILKEKLETLKSKKDLLVSQVQILTHDREKSMENKAFMEKSLSDMSSEVECLNNKLKHFEESCQILSHQNYVLVTERDNLNAQVESMTLDINDTKSRNSELQDQHSSLSRKWDLSTNQIKELQSLLQLEKQETVRSISVIQGLQDEIILLKDNKTKLEEEVELHVREKEILAEKSTQLEEDKNDLEIRHKDLMEQMTTISLTLESHEEEIQEMKERCQVHEAEKKLLMEKLEVMDTISENNVFLKNSLSDANVELEVLREKLAAINDLHEFLNWEKDSLVCQVQNLTYDKEKLSEKNTSLDNSLTEIKSEVESLGGKLKDFQESCQILNHQNSALIDSSSSLASQVQRLNLELRNMKVEFAELRDQNSSLARDWDLSSNQAKELQALLELKNLDDFLFTSVIEDLHVERILLNDQKTKLEDEVGLYLRENKILNLELAQYEEDRIVLERSQRDLMEQIKTVSLTSKSLEIDINKLKEKCDTHEAENKQLLEKLKFLDRILEKNAVLVNTLADANGEIKVLTEKLAALNNSHQSLDNEKDILVSQVRVLTDNLEKLSEERTFLENSLFDVNIEVERLITKLKGFEDSCQFLNDQNSDLTAEKNSLVSHVEKITLEMENITSRFTELQDQHLSLSREWDLSSNQIKDMQSLLELEKEAHRMTIVSYKAQLTRLENKIYQLQNQNQLNQKELEAEQNSRFDAMIEAFVLQATLSDVQERNSILSSEGQKHLKAYISLEALVSQLEQEKLMQLGKIMSLAESNQNVSHKVRQLSSIIGSVQDLRCADENQDAVLLDFIIIKIDKLLTCALEAEFDFQQLHLELSNMRLENISLQKEVEIRNEEILSLQQQQLGLISLNEKIKKNVDASNQRELALEAEAKVLCMMSDEFKEALQKSKCEIVKLLEGNKTLSEELCTLKQKHNELEEEHVNVLLEAMKLDHLHSLFKSISDERLLELMSLNNKLNFLYSTKDDLQNEIDKLNEKICLLEAEKMQLKESVIYLQEELRICLVYMELDVNTARIIFEDIDLELKHTKNQLIHKETQLTEANLMVLSTQASIIEVNRLLESLYKESKEAKLVEEEMRKRVSNLSELLAPRNETISNLREANEMLQKETDNMQNELDIIMTKEKSLRLELEKERMSCEFEFVALLSEHQISAVQAAICEEKLHELLIERETHSTVEKQLLKMEVDSTKTCINELKKKLGDLAGEYKKAKVDMDVYLPLVKSLWTSIASLEAQIMSMPNVKLTSAHEGEVVSSETGHHHSISDEGIKNAGVIELQKLIAKSDFLHEVLISTQKLVDQERFVSIPNLEVTSKEIEDSNREALPQEKQANKNSRTLHGNDEGMDKAAISQRKYRQTMKDIPLDQLSSSVPNSDESTYQIPKNEDAEIDELWEAAETESKSRTRKASSLLVEHDTQTVEVDRSEYPSSELVAEKELNIDKVQMSGRELTSEQTWKGKASKKLESNAQRLSSLRMSIDESKSKMESSEMRKLPASFGYDPIKAQLNEAEEAVLELIDINRDLAKKTEEYSCLDVTDIESKERCSTGRRQVIEQAKKGSEKVGRLELELQKIQYILLKMEEELDSRRRKASERKTRVLLRDYLNGRKGKMRCCGCVKPKTDSD